ncbi:hypothetical protein EYF80_011247 [Liparis tanakae]|uniref:Uncharacterized protein n=1 Tax=Liparis tanakae TaxID=230148 RepID=A0A4Z2ILX1_9TELE|nr:hypothetical protein EYF80_011247 [Liparis tanakae]
MAHGEKRSLNSLTTRLVGKPLHAADVTPSLPFPSWTSGREYFEMAAPGMRSVNASPARHVSAAADALRVLGG